MSKKSVDASTRQSAANNTNSTEQKHTSAKTSKGRRALLASVAAAGAAGSLPSQWKRPVVDSIFLPAHAQTSDSPTSAIVTTLGAIGCDQNVLDTVSAIANTTGATGAAVLYSFNRDFVGICSSPDGGSFTTLVQTQTFTDISTFTSAIFPTAFTTSGMTASFTSTSTFTTTVTI